jgi:tetratricopeptide (TPR) repeat protein
VTDDAQLHNRLRIAWLNEDETGTSFLDLLLRILRALSIAYTDEFPTADLEPIFELKPNEARREASRLLLERLAGRTLLLIVENLDALFDGLGDEGQKQLRAFLQEHPSTAILATSQQLFEGISRRTSPFFGFFQIEHLQPLSLDEAVELLTKIAQNAGDAELTNYLHTPEGRSRVRALHHLSGGNHRVYIVFSQFIDRQSLDELIGPFEKMLDELTPYYQERQRWLSPQQRKITEYLCSCSSPVPVKTIANRLFITEQTAASQLKILRKIGYVLSHTRGRESLYELTEPLMRLSYEVKQNIRQPLRLIVDFLRIWYRPDELRDRLSHLPADAIRVREHLMAAIEASTNEDFITNSILADYEKAKEEGHLEEVNATLEELARIRGKYSDWVYLLKSKYKINNYDEELLKICDKILEIEPKNALVILAYGGLLLLHERFEDALSYFDKSLEFDAKNEDAWAFRGAACYHVHRYNDAILSYDKALELNPDDQYVTFFRIFPLFALGRCEDGFVSLERILSRKRKKNEFDTVPDIARMILLILSSSTFDLVFLKKWVERLISIYERVNKITLVGNALIVSLVKINAKMLSQEALDSWRQIWLDAGAGRPDLAFGLKLFDVGMKYLMTGDRRVLLDLLSTERPIVMEALGLSGETDS